MPDIQKVLNDDAEEKKAKEVEARRIAALNRRKQQALQARQAISHDESSGSELEIEPTSAKKPI